MTQQLMQAYKQAPWRIQTQRIIYVMLGLITLVVVAGLYLSISARTATAAIQIQRLETRRDDLREQNAELENQLALNTTSGELAKRAKDMGFIPVSSEDATFLVVPDYSGRSVTVNGTPPHPNNVAQSVVRPIYTQSLWDWLLQNVSKFNPK
jgi:hypothetical protein